ncbi:hypothetical protein CASFOL_016234 [Castilleja foliolosa]|uniref:KIB1-4 beta-propeller domain-containing protein n=1 Tax=Castilleja foliolosa TaxID=1961234 RepID=A0ABD3DI03_9LAMI
MMMQSEMGKKNRKRQPSLQSEMNTEIEKSQSQPPLLLTIHYTQHKLTVYRPLEGKTHTLECIPVLVHKYILASTHGWLVLVDMFQGDCILWNASSKDTIKLPKLQDFRLYKKCVLSKPPTEPDCHILFIAPGASQQAFCKIGDVEFVYIEEESGLTAITFFQGKIYGVICPGFKFVTIEFVGTTIEFRPILLDGEQHWEAPVVKKNWILWHDINLINSLSGNELFLVIKDFSNDSIMDGSEIRVFRVDINRMECIEIDDLGDEVILIGQYGSGFCCSSNGTNTFKPNSIYYIVNYSSCVYVHDLDDKGTTSWVPHDVSLQFFNQLLNHFWLDLKVEELSR